MLSGALQDTPSRNWSSVPCSEFGRSRSTLDRSQVKVRPRASPPRVRLSPPKPEALVEPAEACAEVESQLGSNRPRPSPTGDRGLCPGWHPNQRIWSCCRSPTGDHTHERAGSERVSAQTEDICYTSMLSTPAYGDGLGKPDSAKEGPPEFSERIFGILGSMRSEELRGAGVGFSIPVHTSRKPHPY